MKILMNDTINKEELKVLKSIIALSQQRRTDTVQSLRPEQQIARTINTIPLVQLNTRTEK